MAKSRTFYFGIFTLYDRKYRTQKAASGYTFCNENEIVEKLQKLINPRYNKELPNGPGVGPSIWLYYRFNHGIGLRAKAYEILHSHTCDHVTPRMQVAFADVLWYNTRMTILERDCQKHPFKKDEWDEIFAHFSPIISCDTIARIGHLGDGGKVVCNLEKFVNEVCVMYSFGVSNELCFDYEFGMITGCEVHSFDPTIGVKDKTYLKDILKLGYVNLHDDMGIGKHGKKQTLNGKPCKSVLEISKKLKHRIVDVVKMDVEGVEFDVIPDMVKTKAFKKLQTKILLLEYHHGNGAKGLPSTCELLRDKFFPLMQLVYEAGFLMYAFEKNVRWSPGAEYAFVHRSFLIDD